MEGAWVLYHCLERKHWVGRNFCYSELSRPEDLSVTAASVNSSNRNVVDSQHTKRKTPFLFTAGNGFNRLWSQIIVFRFSLEHLPAVCPGAQYLTSAY